MRKLNKYLKYYILTTKIWFTISSTYLSATDQKHVTNLVTEFEELFDGMLLLWDYYKMIPQYIQ